MAGPRPRASDHLFLTSFQVTLKLLVWWAHFENHRWRETRGPQLLKSAACGPAADRGALQEITTPDPPLALLNWACMVTHLSGVRTGHLPGWDPPRLVSAMVACLSPPQNLSQCFFSFFPLDSRMQGFVFSFLLFFPCDTWSIQGLVQCVAHNRQRSIYEMNDPAKGEKPGDSA